MEIFCYLISWLIVALPHCLCQTALLGACVLTPVQVRCLSCGYTSQMCEPFMDLSLEFPDRYHCSAVYTCRDSCALEGMINWLLLRLHLNVCAIMMWCWFITFMLSSPDSIGKDIMFSGSRCATFGRSFDGSCGVSFSISTCRCMPDFSWRGFLHSCECRFFRYPHCRQLVLMRWLDFRGQRSRLQQAFEVAKASTLVLGCWYIF